MTEAAAGGAAAGAGDAAAIAAAAAAAAAAGGSGGAGGATALSGGEEKPEAWLPEKYHVKDKDGKLDVTASSKATAKAYRELTTKMVDTGLPPESADKYEFEVPKGFDVAEFRKDPLMQNFLKGAHSQGLTNKQVNYVVNQYLAAAPAIAGTAQQLSSEEVVSKLSQVWKTPAERQAGFASAFTASQNLAKSLGMDFDELNAECGNSPAFIRLMAGLSKQMGEDGGFITGGSITADDFESQKRALEAQLAEVPEYEKDKRLEILAKINVLYQKKFPGVAKPLTG